MAGGEFCPAAAEDVGAAVTGGRVPDVAHPAISVVASRQQSPDLIAAANRERDLPGLFPIRLCAAWRVAS